MKRSIAFVLASVLLCAVLCGCGEADNEAVVTSEPAATVEILPEVSVMPTLDPADGVVKDGDGMIEDTDTGAPDVTVSPLPTVSPAQSAKPTASAKP